MNSTAPQDSLATFAIVCPWFPDEVGGVSTAVRTLYRAIGASGRFRPLLLVNHWPDQVPRLETRDGLDTVWFRLPPVLDRRWPIRSLAGLARSWRQFSRDLGQLVESQGIAAFSVHFVGVDHLSLAVAVRRLPRRPRLILTFHGADIAREFPASGGAVQRWLGRRLAAAADELVFVSESFRQRAASESSIGSEVAARGRVIFNALDGADVEPMRAAAPAGPPYLLCLATLEEKKGIHVLLEAFASIRGCALPLVIAGRSTPFFATLAEQMKALGIADRVSVRPDMPREDALRLLAGASALILPSLTEPFGIVIMEAALLRVPVVASDACGALDVPGVADGCRTFPAGDATALAAVIRDLLEDEDGSARRVRHLAGCVERELGEQTHARHYERLAERR